MFWRSEVLFSIGNQLSTENFVEMGWIYLHKQVILPIFQMFFTDSFGLVCMQFFFSLERCISSLLIWGVRGDGVYCDSIRTWGDDYFISRNMPTPTGGVNARIADQPDPCFGYGKSGTALDSLLSERVSWRQQACTAGQRSNRSASLR